MSALSILPGGNGELSLTMSNNSGSAGIEFKITFDETEVSVGTPTTGLELTNAHSLVSHTTSPNSFHILVYPDPNNNLVPNGQVVKLPVTLLASATAGNKLLTISQTQLSDQTALAVTPERVTNGLLVDPNGTSDSDGDGIPDVTEVANNLHPLDERDALYDPDNDGLNNLAEYQEGTMMDNPDSDGDGFTDGEEILAGTDPLIPDAPSYADNDGEFGSVQTIGMAWGNNSYADIINKIHIDDNNNVYQAGAYRSTLDFNPAPGIENVDSKTSGNYNDAFVTKTNAAGEHQWVWTSYGYYGAYATNAATDGQDNVYVSGYFSGYTDFDPDPLVTVGKNSRYSWDMFYAKLNANGELQWVNTFYYWGTRNEYAKEIAIDSQGNLYIAGYFDANSIDFDPSGNPDYQDRLGYPTQFLSKLDSNGDYAWTQRVGGTNASISTKNLMIDENDNIIIAGDFTGTSNFDANDANSDGDYMTRVSNGDKDIFVMQYAGSGTVNWVYSVGTNHFDQYNASALSGSDIILISQIYDPVDFDAAGSGYILGNANWQIFMTKLGTNGNHVSTQSLFESVISNFSAVAVNQLGNVFIGGTFYQTNVDTNPDPAITETLPLAGSKDIYLLKYSSSGNYLWAKSFGGFRNEIIKDLEFNGLGDLYMSGTFDTYQSTVDFDPGLNVFEVPSAGYEDIFLLKFKTAQ